MTMAAVAVCRARVCGNAASAMRPILARSRSTINRHGCVLELLPDQRATSAMASSSDWFTGRSRKSRTWRTRMSGRINSAAWPEDRSSVVPPFPAQYGGDTRAGPRGAPPMTRDHRGDSWTPRYSLRGARAPGLAAGPRTGGRSGRRIRRRLRRWGRIGPCQLDPSRPVRSQRWRLPFRSWSQPVAAAARPPPALRRRPSCPLPRSSPRPLQAPSRAHRRRQRHRRRPARACRTSATST